MKRALSEKCRGGQAEGTEISVSFPQRHGGACGYRGNCGYGPSPPCKETTTGCARHDLRAGGTVRSRFRYISSVITKPTTPDQAYLEKYWAMIAAIAWKEFTVHGRGALLVQNVGQTDEEAIFLTTRMLASPLTAQYALMAAEYDPEREIVVIFMRPASPVSAYKGAVGGRELPPEACRHLEAILFGNKRNSVDH